MNDKLNKESFESLLEAVDDLNKHQLPVAHNYNELEKILNN